MRSRSRGQGAAGHDAGHRAAEADEHGHDAAARKADAGAAAYPSQRPHGPCSRVSSSMERKKNRVTMMGRKLSTLPTPVKMPSMIRRVERGVDVPAGQRLVGQGGQGIDARRQQVLQARADDAEGEVEHQRHDADKGREWPCICPVRIWSISAAAQLLLALDAALPRSGRTSWSMKWNRISAMAARAVQPALLLHLHDDVLDHLLLVLVQLQGFLNAAGRPPPAWWPQTAPGCPPLWRDPR